LRVAGDQAVTEGHYGRHARTFNGVMIGRVQFAVPAPLAPGDVIAVVAPSSPLPLADLWRGLAWLGMRYRLRMRSGVLAREGYLAGSDDRRRDELMAAMLDPEVKAIVAARGGYGAMRIVGELPWAALAAHPKWIVGHSDVTALHAMAWGVGVAAVHAPNVTGLGCSVSVRSRAAWLGALERPGSARAWRALRVVRSGEATGPLVGGNLALVHALAAAGRLAFPAGAIVALEDVNEAPYRIDRMITSLVMGGHLSGASAVVFGGFDRCAPREDGATVDDVLDQCIRPLGVPVLAGAPFGHGAVNDAFVLGQIARVQGDEVLWNGSVGSRPSR
jgi:muramoyltetrapeptide carboxypeptidase